MTATSRQSLGAKEDIAESLRARASELWGNERAIAMQPAIETTAEHIWQLSQDLPPSSEEPGFYFNA